MSLEQTSDWRSTAVRRNVIISWSLTIVALAVWCYVDHPGWDVTIYLAAIHSIAAGLDPYAAAMALQRSFHAQYGGLRAGIAPPYSYVYSPITLPVLHGITHIPLWLAGVVYALLFVAAALAPLWVAAQLAEPEERVWLAYLTPIALFFPGLLVNDAVKSGNIGYILYASILVAALYGWRKDNWWWFYGAVLVASCVKAPFLSLVLIAPLSARRQVLPAAITLVAGLSVFGMQAVLWPTLFHHYLQAVELQFSYNRDFGSSPAGLYSAFRFDRGLPYAPAAYFFFLGYALPVFACLVYLANSFLQGRISLRQWAPMLLAGVILLNPRLQEYDVAPITLPLLLIAWRWFAVFTDRSRLALAGTVVLWLTLNVFAARRWETRKEIEGPLLIVLFVVGAWTLRREALAQRHLDTPSSGELAVA